MCITCGIDPCGCNTHITHDFNWNTIPNQSCEPCSDVTVCKYNYPAVCVLINVDLPNLQFEAGDNVQEILQAIDALIAANFNIPFAAVDSTTIAWTSNGPQGHNPTADVKVSEDAGNIIQVRPDGLFAPASEEGTTDDHKVMVDTDDTPDYLENQMIGIASDDGIMQITVVNDAGLLKIKPIIDIDALATIFCGLCAVPAAPALEVDCDGITILGAFKLGVPSSGLISIPVTVVGSGQIIVTATINNGSFYGSNTQIVNELTTVIDVAVFYNGNGSDGTQTLTVDFSGTDTATSCDVDIAVEAADACVAVSIIATTLPDGSIGVPYAAIIPLSGTAPFTLSAITKPAWMTLTVVGSNVEVTGTPNASGTGIAVDFTANNCSVDTDSFTDTIDINPYSIAKIGGACAGGINTDYLISGGTTSDVVTVRATFTGLIQKNSLLFTRADLFLSSPDAVANTDTSSTCYLDTNPHGFTITTDIVITMTGATASVHTIAVTNNSSAILTSMSVNIIDVNGDPITDVTANGCVGNSSTGGTC